MKKFAYAFISTLVMCILPAPSLSAKSLPKGFVYLRNIDPTIIQDMRYATPDNFTGKIVPGYAGGECILTERTAKYLVKAQNELRSFGLSLKVFDCFRPQEAVDHFVRWAHAKPNVRGPYHPAMTRTQLFKRGYIARHSTHSKGIAVDVTIGISISNTMAPVYGKNDPCDLPKNINGTEKDMGTGFDCFNPRSHTKSPQNTTIQQKHRATLLSTMEKYGFRNYHKEWWHFTLVQ